MYSENNENDEIIDYSINCYYINYDKSPVVNIKNNTNNQNNESIINYQGNCIGESEDEEQQPPQIIQKLNDKVKESIIKVNENQENLDNNDDEIIQFSNFNDTINYKEPTPNNLLVEEDANDANDVDPNDGNDDIIEYTSQVIITNNNNQSTNNQVSLQAESDDDDESDYESQQYEYDSEESIDPDVMTYEQLLELQDKIGFVNRGFSDSMIKVLFIPLI